MIKCKDCIELGIISLPKKNTYVINNEEYSLSKEEVERLLVQVLKDGDTNGS